MSRAALAWTRGALRRAEDGLVSAALLAMCALPVCELALRWLMDAGIPGSQVYVEHLTLWVGFLGAMVASREDKHLGLAAATTFLPARVRAAGRVAAAVASVAVATGLAWAAYDFVRIERAAGSTIGALPVWAAIAILPAAFSVIALRFVRHAGGWRARACALAGIPLAWVIGSQLADHAGTLLVPGIALLVLAVPLGAPLFVVIGGAALLLFFADWVPVAAIPVETYRLVVSPFLPAIPLFTLAGYLLAEGQASARLMRVFQAWMGWMPGGLAIMATVVCVFFTTFTGASGVTILALGGVLMPSLLKAGYRERFSVGLLTSTGSLGLLFPPCVPVILYAVVARIPIPELFLAALVPGVLLVVAVSLLGVREAVAAKVPRQRFDPGEATRALWAARWELLLPVIPIVGMFVVKATPMEAAALTAAYALVVQVGIHRDVHAWRDLPRVLVGCATLLGGVFAILGVAMGLTNYLVDAQVPMRMTEWVQTHIESKLVFLLALNVFLLVVGCLMDIYSAIVVVVPLILPISAAFDVHPLHLGVIFLVNLEIGYLTPPIGMNLFLSSYRFERPLGDVYRSTLPFFFVLLGVVLLVTYVPMLTTWASGAP